VLNVGVGEMLVIIVVALLVFGPNRLPEITRNVAKFLRNFQQETNRALSDLKEGIEPATTGIFDQPDPAPAKAAAPAAAFGAAPASASAPRRKTSTRAKATGRTPARKNVASQAKRKPATSTAAKKKPSRK